jgi:thioredoxin 1
MESKAPVAANIITLNGANFEEEVLFSPVPVLVDFWAEWCNRSKSLQPVLDEIAGEYSGRIKVARINFDEQPDLVGEYGVRATPTLLLFKGGQVVEQMINPRTKRDIKLNLDRVVFL